jgi:hypothetical protein
MVPTRSKTGGPGRPAAGSSDRRALRTALGVGLALAGLGALGLQAADALQFDVFLGYGSQPTGSGGTVHEIGWSTLGCEVHNPGPQFQATFEFSPGQFDRGQTYRLQLELPTNTRKRFVLPILTGGAYVNWNARLLDERGRTRAETGNLQPQGVAWESLLLGALPRTFGGLPNLPQLTNDSAGTSHHPRTIRLLPELFPDNPIALEGLNAIYLNADRAAELKPPQAGALVQWLVHGGHLILAVEDSSAVHALPWLEALVPFTFGGTRTVRPPTALTAWGNPLTFDPSAPHPGTPDSIPESSSSFPKYNPADLHHPVLPTVTGGTTSNASALQDVEFPVIGGTVTDGRVLLDAAGNPLIVRTQRGRGTVTLLTFSPEREPFRSWDNRGWFWARLLQLPPAWFEPGAIPQYGGTSIDGLFGVLLDSRQIQTLPVAWLLLLLAVYLAVIGPLDRMVLKRWRREMWTWVSFPTYVAVFSLLIYYVGFRLRAGDTEWNELHLVDFLPSDTAAPWRGRTYASLYSPITTRYRLASTLPNATLRGELIGYTQPSGNITLTYRDQGFSAELAVPVWTSQLLVSDWTHSNSPPYSAQLLGTGNRQRIVIQNHLDRPLRELRLAFRGRMHELGDLEPLARVEHSLSQVGTRAIHEFIFQGTSSLFTSVQQRQLAFGSDHRRWPEPHAALLTAASFPTHAGGSTPLRDRQFVAPPDFDLSPAIARGDAVLFAWVPDYAPVPTLRDFDAPRTRQNTLFRLNLPLGNAPGFQL